MRRPFLPALVKRGFRSLLLLACLSQVGCVVLPGMHVDVDDGEARAAREGYRLVPVTPQVVRDQRLASTLRETSLRDYQALSLPAMNPTVAVRDYVVGPGDVLQIAVWDHPELTNPFGAQRQVGDGIEVGADGFMFFPYAGLVKVAGLTLEEIRKLLSDRLGVVARTPQVGIRIVLFRSQRAHVIGEVMQPGLVPLDNTNKGLLEALSERGGLTERASRRRVYLIRGASRYEINLRRLYGNEQGSLSPMLLPGDVIRVPDASDDEVMVLGDVFEAKSVTLPEDNLSIMSAIAAAGGISKATANGSQVFVFRAAEPAADADPAALQGPPVDVYQLDLRRPQGVVLGANFELRPHDVVYVDSTALSQYNSVVSQLLPTLTEIFYVDRLTLNRN